MGLLSREPKRREPPTVQTMHVLHKTEENVKLRLGGVIWIEDLMASPDRHGNIEYRYLLVQHPSQTSEEFERLAQLAIDISNGKVASPCYIVPLKRKYPPLSGCGSVNF